jgi:hypothetical protein
MALTVQVVQAVQAVRVVQGARRVRRAPENSMRRNLGVAQRDGLLLEQVGAAGAGPMAAQPLLPVDHQVQQQVQRNWLYGSSDLALHTTKPMAAHTREKASLSISSDT